MTALDRPRLADVLARVTTCDDVEAWRSAQGYRTGVLPLIAAKGDGAILRPKPWQGTFHPWAHPSPADALGALVEAALLPEHWADEGRAPRWWCEGCEGVGYAKPRSADDLDPYTGAPMWRCGVCGSSEAGRGLLAAPPSHAALCAVASLGVDTLARAEAIVAETWPRARLVWRVMGAAELNAVLRRNYETPTHGNRVAFWFACEAVGLWSQRWPEEFRFWSASDAPPEVIAMMDERRRLYPAMRALALTEDGRPTGLHLVALDDARVVLAVEALP